VGVGSLVRREKAKFERLVMMDGKVVLGFGWCVRVAYR